MSDAGIPCMWMRGGTSKGPYFLAKDLPSDPAQRNQVLLAAMGSPDARQIDGLGGADTLTINGTGRFSGRLVNSAALAVNVVQLVAEERTLKGSYIGTCVPARDIPRYVALFRQGRLPVDRLLSGTIGLERINAAFDDLAEGRAVRTVVAFPP